MSCKKNTSYRKIVAYIIYIFFAPKPNPYKNVLKKKKEKRKKKNIASISVMLVSLSQWLHQCYAKISIIVIIVL
jgi:accessory gene regulator protein AgrB